MDGGCDMIPGYHYWVAKENSKSKKKVMDACTLVDQLVMLGVSQDDFIKTYTATSSLITRAFVSFQAG
jgi:hypothetical protein